MENDLMENDSILPSSDPIINIRQFDGPDYDVHGKWYVVRVSNNGLSSPCHEYLHSNLKWRSMATDERGNPVGYYDTHEQAEATLKTYRLMYS